MISDKTGIKKTTFKSSELVNYNAISALLPHTTATFSSLLLCVQNKKKIEINS